MKSVPDTAGSDGKAGSGPRPNPRAPKRRRHRVWRGVGIFLLVVALLLGVGRAILPWAVRGYVNRTLDRNPLYQGTLGTVQIHLWRGAYSIEDVRITKTTGDVPVPFFAAKRVDFALEWNALRQRKVVGRVLMDQAEINIVDVPDEGEAQTGGGGYSPCIDHLRRRNSLQECHSGGKVILRLTVGQTGGDVVLG